MRHPPYPAYKPSGVEWLGEVPEHWTITKANFAFSIQLGKMLQPEVEGPTDEEVPYLKAQHVQWEDVHVDDLPTMWASESDRIKYAIHDGDLLVCEGGDVGRAGIVRSPPAGTIIQNALHRVRAKGLNETRLLVYILEHAASRGWFEIICNRATIAHFTSEKFAALSLALPLPPEQRAIVNFLDHQTAKIDTLMAKRRALIESLKEKRTALISQTVTLGLPPNAARDAGLDPYPPLKPSGVEWLGEVPEHWEVKRLKYVSRMKAGEGITADMFDEDGDNPVYGGNGLRGYTSGFTHEGEYVLVGRQGALCGNINYAKGRFWASEHAIVVTPNANVQVYWLGEVLRSMNLNQYSIAAAQPGLAIDDIKSLSVAVPPLHEQQAIAMFLERETTKIDRMVSLEEAVIERQQEYRSALITAAVTGKIDVRAFSHEQGTGVMRGVEA